MIIDFHAHVFPHQIASRTVHHLEQQGRVVSYADGTVEDLKLSMKEAGVTHSVVLPIVTKPEQFRHILDFACSITSEQPDEDGLSIISFGGVHPSSFHYKEELREIRDRGLKGIKLHPFYQQTFIDDIRYERVIDYATALGLIVSIHCGRDLGYPRHVYARPDAVHRMLDDIFPDGQATNIILAHLGGHDMEDDAEHLLIGGDYYMDLAYVLRLALPSQILRMCRHHGIDKILFASDSPWSGQKEDVEYIKRIGFTEEELEQIFWKNGAKLLGLSAE